MNYHIYLILCLPGINTLTIIPHDSLDHFTYQGPEHFFANHIFTFTGPKLWNSLPPNLTRLKSINSFKRFLKDNVLVQTICDHIPLEYGKLFTSLAQIILCLYLFH